ncbi:MAG: hypothetical protein HY259_10910 [Chloroflexi bacterium]|nr:hypothetical protein [Chloroflexota bacterium]
MDHEKNWQRAAENIMGDESLISRLTDAEAKVLLDWAIHELESNPNDCLPRVRQAMKLINDLVGGRARLSAGEITAYIQGFSGATPSLADQARRTFNDDMARLFTPASVANSVELIRKLTGIVSAYWNNTPKGGERKGALP